MNYKIKIFICFFALMVGGCRSDQDFTSNNDDLAEAPDQEGFDAMLTTTSKGQLRWQIRYKRMERYSSQKQSRFFDGVTIDFYENGEHSSRVKMREATLNERTNEIEFKGNVRIKSDHGISLFTEKLLWSDSRGKATSDDFVTVVTAESDTIHGTGFESERSFKNWVIKKPYGVTQKKLNLNE
ncbi:MAG: LPS export ABC transporter periplasmic protein LptC [bacterium]